jgi:uncharacterized membrane protein YfcA
VHADGAVVTMVGLGAGVLYGLFGAGGSAFATPILALVGVPPVLAVASPLPATIPAALAGAWSYRRTGALDTTVARRALVAGAPAALAGAVATRWIGGHVLLLLSGALLLAAGVRLALPAIGAPEPGRPDRAAVVVPVACAVIGFVAGLLANSGGFLLVPFFLVVMGLDMRTAAATSLLVAAALTVPTAVVHVALGHVDWRVAALTGAGLVPGSVLGSRLSRRFRPDGIRRVFGVGLAAFAVWFITQTAR